MFGFFKKKEAATSPARIVRLLEIFESLSTDADDLYSDVEKYNPAEVRFFTMSAISVNIQSYGNLAEADMHHAVGKFTEQAIASLLFKMPRSSYDVLHNAFVDRFEQYAELITTFSSVDTAKDLQDAILNLMTTLDHYSRVERDAVDKITQGMKIVKPLTDAAGDVADVFRHGR